MYLVSVTQNGAPLCAKMKDSKSTRSSAHPDQSPSSSHIQFMDPGDATKIKCKDPDQSAQLYRLVSAFTSCVYT